MELPEIVHQGLYGDFVRDAAGRLWFQVNERHQVAVPCGLNRQLRTMELVPGRYPVYGSSAQDGRDLLPVDDAKAVWINAQLGVRQLSAVTDQRTATFRQVYRRKRVLGF